MKAMKDYKQKTEKVIKVPESVQDLIPVDTITRDGIFCLERKDEGADLLFDKAYVFSDINFAPLDDNEKTEVMKSYCYLWVQQNVDCKVTIINSRRNLDEVAKAVFINAKQDAYAKLSEDFNEYVEESLSKGCSGIHQMRVFVLTCRKKNLVQAREFFKSVETNLIQNFKTLGSVLLPMDASARLKLLYQYFHLGTDYPAEIDFDKVLASGKDWKDFVSPQMIREYRNEYGDFDGMTLQMEDRYIRVLAMDQLPKGIDTDSLGRVLSGDFCCSVAIDVVPIPRDVSHKFVYTKYMQTGRSIEVQQGRINSARAYSSEVSYEIRRQKMGLEDVMDTLNDNNEKMFYVGLYFVVTGRSKKQLEANVLNLTGIAEGEGIMLQPVYWAQVDAFLTSLPLGARFCTIMYPVTSQPLAALIPFHCQELYEEGGIVYGVNQISGNILIGNRWDLNVFNGLLIGQSGSGKSMLQKIQKMQVYFGSNDRVIDLDPNNEREQETAFYKGQYIDLSTDGTQYLNVLSTNALPYMQSKESFIRDKTQLMIAIHSQINPKIGPEALSMIGRVVSLCYRDEVLRSKKEPTLKEYKQIMLAQEPQDVAKRLALELELYVNGPLNMFAKPSNVDIHNRFVTFGLKGIDKEFFGISMTVMLEEIRYLLAKNANEGYRTWINIDEMHNLTHNPYSAAYLEKIWREVRKMGGACTGITQSVMDLFSNPSAQAILSNTSFMMIGNLKENERVAVQNQIGISRNMMQYIQTQQPGCGLMKFGDLLIPYDGRIPVDSEMFRLFNTDFANYKGKKHKVKIEAENLEKTFRDREGS